MENMTKIQTELLLLEKTMSEMKNTLNGISTLDTTGEKICEVQYIAIEMTQYEMGEKEKNK